MRAVLLLVAVAFAACSETLPPYPQVQVIVDTDMPVPRLVSRLRLDVYAEDGTWIDSREEVLRDRRDLPVSFTVFSTREARGLVRVRAYGDGAIVDERSELRLVKEGRDVTPRFAPDPELAIDRLVRVRLARPAIARVRLEGICAGMPARGTETCLAGARVEAPEASDAPLAPAPVFGEGPATSLSPREHEIVVPAGAFVLGGRDLGAEGEWFGVQVTSSPPRLVRVPSFLIDRSEVTVARWRAALARGFAPRVPPVHNDGPLPQTFGGSLTDASCTFSTAPRDREDMPLTCVTFEASRAFCVFEGGDLPSEAEWEYAATAAARPHKTSLPWGEGRATCEQAVFARVRGAAFTLMECAGSFPVAPSPVGRTQDRTPVLEIQDLGGNVSEWTRDVYAAYSDPCWADGTCQGRRRTVRGGSFAEPREGLQAIVRKPADPDVPYPGLGLRCVRREGAR
jgi:formylglycine-generating enzyme required for sulfatase activity